MMDAVSLRPRIVVADDHAEMRKRITGLLTPSFDVVAAVADGQEAVAATEALQPEVVVLDMSMPVLNGIQAATRIRRMARVPRILFVTAVDDQAIAAALLSLGASTLVLKRDMVDELVPAVWHALSTPYTHAVCVYADSASLCETVARFLGDGIAADEPALIMATAKHSADVLGHLASMGIDRQMHIARGDLVLLDADHMMALGATEDMPAVFGREVLPIVERMRRGGAKFPRVYGEVGGLLWGNGQSAAALRLEEAWNKLDISRRCSTLCSYAADAVVEGAGLRKLCHHHDEVVQVA